MSSSPMKASNGNSTKILAKSFFKELRENGYDHNAIVSISTELLDLVTRELKGDAITEAAPQKVVELRKAL